MKTINVNEETYEKIKEHLSDGEAKTINSIDDLIGEKFYFRTVTYHIVGKVKKHI